MVAVLADSPLIERCLLRIVALAEAAGAGFHRDVVVKCIDGNLSIEAPPETAGSVLMRLPWDCLVPTAPFELAIAGDAFIATSHQRDITDGCVAMMDATLELFNLAQKLTHHRRTSPWSLIASHPELLTPLLTGRRSRYGDAIASGRWKDVELESFFQTRAFSYTETPDAPPFPVVLPVLDAMNHHPLGAPYSYDKESEDGPTVTMARSNPLPAQGNECFATYGNYDCYDIWMNYGFIDGGPDMLRSRTMRIELPGLGAIQLADYFKPRASATLPPPVNDLSFYIPKLFARGKNWIAVAAVTVPGPRAPRALRRTLHFLISELRPDRPVPRDLVLHAEQQVIAGNTEYYEALVASLRTVQLLDEMQRPILDNFIRMCELQLGRLRDYPGYVQG